MQICFHHHLAQLLQGGLGLPAQQRLCLGWVAYQQLHLCWAVKLRVDSHDRFASNGINGRFFFLTPFKVHLDVSALERHHYKVTHRLCEVCCQHKYSG